MKKMTAFKLSEEVLKALEELAQRTGKSKTQIVEESILRLYQEENKGKKDIESQLELLEKYNFQLQQAIKAFQVALESKEQVLKEKENQLSEKERIIISKDALINEKNERIKDLQEKIKLLKQSQKKWWKFWE